MNYRKFFSVTILLINTIGSLYASDQAQPLDFGNQRLLATLSATTYNVPSSDPEVVSALLSKLAPYESPTFVMSTADIHRMLEGFLGQTIAGLLEYTNIKSFFEENGFTQNDFMPPTDPTQNEGNVSLRTSVSQVTLNNGLPEVSITLVFTSNTRPQSLGFIIKSFEEALSTSTINLAKAMLCPYGIKLPLFTSAAVNPANIADERLKLATYLVKNLKIKANALLSE